MPISPPEHPYAAAQNIVDHLRTTNVDQALAHAAVLSNLAIARAITQVGDDLHSELRLIAARMDDANRLRG